MFAALIGLAGAVVAITAGSGLGVTGDGVAYLSTARAIAAGEGSRAVVEDDRPPGFAILLSPLCAFDSMPLRSARILAVIASIATAVLTFLLMRMRVGQAVALLAAGLVATNGLLIDHSNYLLSELPFTALALGALVFFERWRLTDESPRPASLVMAAVLTAAAALVRVVGLALVPVGMLALRANRSGVAGSRIRVAVMFACMASASSLAWLCGHAGPGQPGSYLSQFAHPRDAFEGDEPGWTLPIDRAVRLLPQRLTELAQALLPRSIAWRLWTEPLRWAACGVGLVVALVMMRTAVRDRGGPALFAFLSWTMLLAWPWDEGARFVVPLVPVVIGIVVESASRLGCRYGSVMPVRTALAGVAVVAVSAHAYELVLTARRLPAMQAKFTARVERGHAVSDALRELPRECSIVALVPQGEDAKVDLALGGYLAERRVEIIDCAADAEIARSRCDVLVTHRRVPSTWATNWDCEPFAAVQEFILWRSADAASGKSRSAAEEEAQPPFFSMRAHVSLRDTARLNTSDPGRESGSMQK